MKAKIEKRYRRHKRVRAKIKGTAKVPRLCVFRSSRHIYAQLVDDEKRKTLTAGSDFELKKGSESSDRSKLNLKGKEAIAYRVGKLLAQKALAKKIKKVVFDRGGYRYHGRVKAIAEGARSAGLEF